MIACLAYVVVSQLIDSPAAVRLLNSIIITTSGACVVLYAPLAWRALTSLRPTNAQYMGLGLELASLGSLGQRVTSLMVRDFDLRAFTDNVIIPLSLFIILVSRLFQIIAIYADDDGLPRRKWLDLVAIVASGVLLALLVTAVQMALTWLNY